MIILSLVIKVKDDVLLSVTGSATLIKTTCPVQIVSIAQENRETISIKVA